ncbi:MAG: hypothetical protein NVV73_07295 [Cellvibrionaceae bacterium]|nr:hypothetical protein [Cellvibrionaceae bacterium]
MKRYLSFVFWCTFSMSAPATYAGEQVKSLTVIVNFSSGSGITAFSDAQARDLFNLLNQPGYSQHGNAGSLRDYFLDNSNLNLDLSSKVVIVHLPTSRDSYINGSDLVGERYAVDPHTNTTFPVLDLTGGPLSNLTEAVLCRLVGGAGCTAGIQYRVVSIPVGSTVPAIGAVTTTAFDFSALSKSETVFKLDWLDRRHIVGGATIETFKPGVVPHFRFFQMLVPGSSGSHHKQGLWPRVVPSTRTDRHALGGYALGPVQLVPIPEPATPSLGVIAHETGHSIGYFKDQYDLQSLSVKVPNFSIYLNDPSIIYDAPAEGETYIETSHMAHDPSWYKSHGVADFSLMGGTTTAHRNPPLVDAYNREAAGWESPLDIIDASEGEVFTIDWSADGSNPNVARSFKYCKPDSNLSECFYIEARGIGWNRARNTSSVRQMYTGVDTNGDGSGDAVAEGLMIWHTERYDNPFDFNINQRKEGTGGLHFDVALVQADGLRQLEGPEHIVIDAAGKLFNPSIHNRFDDFTPATSRWWDGTVSGLSLRNIQFTSGQQMTFEIGKRPIRPVFIDFDPAMFSIEVNGVAINGAEPLNLPVGNFALKVIPISNSKPYKVYQQSGAATNWSATLTGMQTLQAKNTFRENIIKIQNNLSFTKYAVMEFRIDEGATVQYLRGLQQTSKLIKPNTPYWPKKSEAERIAETVAEFTGNYNPKSQLFNMFAFAKPGFRIVDWSVDYRDGQAPAAGTGARIQMNDARMVNQSDSLPYIVRVRAERIPGQLCAQGATEQWKWDGEYSDLETKVRFNNSIYSANVPRASNYYGRIEYVHQGFPGAGFSPTYDPSSDPAWSRIDDCGAYTTSCQAFSEWNQGTMYTAGSKVKFNGQLWTAEMNHYGQFVPGLGASWFVSLTDRSKIYPGDVAPGEHAAFWKAYIRTIKTEADSFQSLGLSDMYGRYPLEPIWTLVGNCNDSLNIQRGFILAHEGASLRQLKNGVYVPIENETYWSRQGSSSDEIFEFKLSAGYANGGVLIDGVQVIPTAGPGGAYIVTIPYAGRTRPAYVEVRTTRL